MKTQCSNCQNSFRIQEGDYAYYNRLEVPPTDNVPRLSARHVEWLGVMKVHCILEIVRFATKEYFLNSHRIVRE